MPPILFSSEFSAENGQAVVTREVARSILNCDSGTVMLIYAAGASVRGMASWLLASLRIVWAAGVKRPSFVYLVGSRTTFGFLRDIPALAFTLVKGRVVVHCHGSDIEALLKEGWISPIARFFYARAEVIFPCQYLAQRTKSFVRYAHVCENFVGYACPIEPAPKATSPALSVLWNSNVMASKGFLELAEAVRRAVEEGHLIELTSFGSILSDTEMSADMLGRKLAHYEQFDWFKYQGKVPHLEAVSRLQSCDVVALPSRYPSEMQPLAIIEAMCAGRKIVTADRPSLRATVGSYPASFLKTSSVEEIGAVLIELYKMKTRDPTGFACSTLEQANVARDRYSLERFRARMSRILFRNVQDA